MPRTKKGTPPAYRCHASGQAVVTVRLADGNRKDLLLSPFDSPASHEEYASILVTLAANSGRWPGEPTAPSAGELSVNELCLAYWRHAERYYVKDGRPTSEQHAIRCAPRYVRELYGLTPARQFGPLALKAVRQKLIDHPVTTKVKVRDHETGEVRWETKLLRQGLARRNVNKLVAPIKLMFGWGVAEEMLPASVHEALLRVEGLRKGKGPGREKPRVKPVAPALVEATLPHLPPLVRGMVEVQRLTGARPQDVVGMRAVDIDMTGPVWEYRPPHYKTEHRNEDDDPDRERIVFIGPRAQEVIKHWLPMAVDAYIFRPALSEELRNQKRRQVVPRAGQVNVGQQQVNAGPE